MFVFSKNLFKFKSSYIATHKNYQYIGKLAIPLSYCGLIKQCIEDKADVGCSERSVREKGWSIFLNSLLITILSSGKFQKLEKSIDRSLKLSDDYFKFCALCQR